MPWNFRMKVLKYHKYQLECQTHKGRLVEDFQGAEILNQKGEWGCNLTPTLTTERNLESEAKAKRKKDIPRHEESQDSNPPQAKRPKKSKIPEPIRAEIERKTLDRNSPKDDKGETLIEDPKSPWKVLKLK